MIKKEIIQWLHCTNWNYNDFEEILQQTGISKPYHLKKLNEKLYTGINDNGRFKIQLIYTNNDKIGNMIAVTQRNETITYSVPFKRYNSEHIKIHLIKRLLISDYKILDSKYDNDFSFNKVLSLEHNDKNYLLTFKLSSKVKFDNKYFNNKIIDDYIFSLEYRDFNLIKIFKIIINLLNLSEEFLDGCEISFFLEKKMNCIGNQVIEGFHIKNNKIQEYIYRQYSQSYDMYKNGDWIYIDDSDLQVSKLTYLDGVKQSYIYPLCIEMLFYRDDINAKFEKISKQIAEFKYKLDEKLF